MDNHIFRSAALGFNRQDVLEYIEKVQKEAESKSADLTSQLDAARQEGGASRQALEDCTQERDRLSQELAELKEQSEAELAELKERYEAETEARSAAQSELDRQRDRLQELEAENRRLTEQVQKLEEQAEDLRREKERLTQLELDAHHRSDELLSQAQVQADDILSRANTDAADLRTQAQVQADELQAQAQAQADGLLAQARSQTEASVEKCQSLLRSFESLASHVSGELRKMSTTVNQLPVGMDSLRQELTQLLEPEAEQ